METERLGTLSRSAARSKVDQLRAKLGQLGSELKAVDRSSKAVIKLVIALHEGQAWKACGLGSWEELIEVENLRFIQVPRSDRTELIREMAAGHFSSYAMAPVLGISVSTAQRDMKSISGENGRLPSMIRSLDGLARPRKKRNSDNSVVREVVGQSTLVFAESTDLPFELSDFLADIGATDAPDERVDQLTIAEAISTELQLAVDSLGDLNPLKATEHHMVPLRRLLQNTETSLQRARTLATQWGVAI